MGKHDTAMTQKGRSSADYAVGYGKPPTKTRFQAGKSGNPKGRPKGGETIKSAISKVMGGTFVVTEDGKRRRMPAVEAILRGLMTKATNGDVRAARFLIEQKEKHSKPADPEFNDRPIVNFVIERR
jgi:hypothetical protein